MKQVVQVPVREIISAPFSTYQRQTDSYSCGIHILLLSESLLLRTFENHDARLDGVSIWNERRRIYYLLVQVRRGEVPTYVPPGVKDQVSKGLLTQCKKKHQGTNHS